MPGRPALGMALIEPLAQEAVIDPAEGTANGTSAIGSGAVGVGTSAFSFLRGLKVGAEGWEKPSNLVELTWDSPRYFPATLRSVESYEDIAACGTYMGYADGSLFGLDSYVQIRACGTYRRRSQPLAPFSDGNRVAPHVVGMLLTVAPPVVGARPVLFLLQRINPAKVIRVLSPPFLIGFPLLLVATVRPTTGLLSLFEPRMGMKPTTAERTSPPREHTFLLQ